MKVFVAVFALIVSALALSEQEYQDQFTAWMQAHSKSYHHDEFSARYRVWKSNLDLIHQHNSQNKGYTLAMNKFGDLSNS
jgi:hypothetical protein